MAARLKLGESVLAGDRIIFNLRECLTLPTTIGPSIPSRCFSEMYLVRDADLTVLVGSGKDATALVVKVSADMILVEDDESVTVTVELKDEDGNEVRATENVEVDLDSATGSFMVDGVEKGMVTITAGTSSAMASYTDSTLGEATITASSGTLTEDTATVTVTTDLAEITSADSTIVDSDGVTKDVARDGDTITVTASGNPANQTDVTFDDRSIVIGGGLETWKVTDSPGNYTGSHTLAMGTPDGDRTQSPSVSATKVSRRVV